MNNDEDILIRKLNDAALITTDTAAELHFKTQELQRSITNITSSTKIGEAIESLSTLTFSLRSAMDTLASIRLRFNI